MLFTYSLETKTEKDGWIKHKFVRTNSRSDQIDKSKSEEISLEEVRDMALEETQEEANIRHTPFGDEVSVDDHAPAQSILDELIEENEAGTVQFRIKEIRVSPDGKATLVAEYQTDEMKANHQPGNEIYVEITEEAAAGLLEKQKTRPDNFDTMLSKADALSPRVAASQNFKDVEFTDKVSETETVTYKAQDRYNNAVKSRNILKQLAKCVNG